LYVGGKSDIPLQLLHSVLSPYLQIGTTESLHCCENHSLFQTELISLWISEHNVLPPAWNSFVLI